MEKQKELLMKDLTTEQLISLVQEIHGYDGSLEDYYTYEMEFLNDIGMDTFELLRSAQYGNFNVNHDSFNFDGYGNLKSYNEFDYNRMIEENKEEIIDEAMRLHEEGNIDINDFIMYDKVPF